MIVIAQVPHTVSKEMLAGLRVEGDFSIATTEETLWLRVEAPDLRRALDAEVDEVVSHHGGFTVVPNRFEYDRARKHEAVILDGEVLQCAHFLGGPVSRLI